MSKEILQFIKDKVGEPAQHSEGEFWNIHNDRSSASWGWNEPLKYKNYRIVFLSFSPRKKENFKGGIFFDYITNEEYQDGLKKDLDL